MSTEHERGHDDAGDTVLAAQVVLRPASGGSVSDAPITAENVADFLPDPADARHAAAWFAAAGFEVHELVGISFAISGVRSTFEAAFGTAITVTGRAWTRTAREEGGSLTLPLDPLPGDVARVVEAVEFTPPPDFGPTDW